MRIPLHLTVAQHVAQQHFLSSEPQTWRGPPARLAACILTPSTLSAGAPPWDMHGPPGAGASGGPGRRDRYASHGEKTGYWSNGTGQMLISRNIVIDRSNQGTVAVSGRRLITVEWSKLETGQSSISRIGQTGQGYSGRGHGGVLVKVQ